MSVIAGVACFRVVNFSSMTFRLKFSLWATAPLASGSQSGNFFYFYSITDAYKSF